MSDSDARNGGAKLARRLETDSEFMAYVLAEYRGQEHRSLEQLQDELGIASSMLTRLSLCRRPDTNSPEFAEQVREIADYALLDEAQQDQVKGGPKRIFIGGLSATGSDDEGNG